MDFREKPEQPIQHEWSSCLYHLGYDDTLQDLVEYFGHKNIPLCDVSYGDGCFQYVEEESADSFAQRQAEYQVELADWEQWVNENRDALIVQVREDIINMLIESHKQVKHVEEKYSKQLEEKDTFLSELEAK